MQKRSIWLGISGAMVALSLLALLVWGLKPGIDFTGGSLMETRFLFPRPDAKVIEQALSDLELGSLIVQPSADDKAIIRFQNTDEEKHQAALARLEALGPASSSAAAVSIETDNPDIKIETGDSGWKNIEELRYDAIGPSIGQELKRKTIFALFLALVAIIGFIALTFRKVSKPVASWKYGVAAVIALFHDVLITAGVFAVLGHFWGIEVNTPFVAALLTILGYSINDTIVVFDRIRENLPKSEYDFEGTVNWSINQTIARSINTSLTVELALIAIILLGGATIQSFTIALAVGIGIGTYSSIFVASPVLVIWDRLTRRR